MRPTTVILFNILFCMADALVFNYTSFRAKTPEKTIISYRSVQRTLLESNDTNIFYLSGQISVTHDITNTNVKAKYRLRRRDGKKIVRIQNIPDDLVPYCEYNLGFYKNFTLPMTDDHNDFPSISSPTDCVVKRGRYNLFEVDNTTQINAPSQLPAGDYQLDVQFVDTLGILVGGHSGYFTALDL